MLHIRKPPFLFTGLFSLAAVIYNSWPLGYLLDKATARYGVASDLEDPNHPYAWLFITCDVITALILVGLSMYLYMNRPKMNHRYIWISLCLGLLTFGFFTGFGAAAPDRCYGIGSACFKVLNNSVSVDGLETSLAGFGLLLALFSSACLSYFFTKRYILIYWLTFAGYFASGSLLFHSVSLNMNAHSIEQVYLVLCGVGLILVGVVADKAMKKT